MSSIRRKRVLNTLRIEAARTLSVTKQGLAQRPRNSDKQTLRAVIRQIGFLQLDTINVVDRSHYLVMLSRLGRYNREELDALLYPNRLLFEQWAHAACLIPIEDFQYFSPVICARRNEPLSARRKEKLGDDPATTLKFVLARVAKRGPLMSRDFDDPRDDRGTWWNHKPAKVALDWLHYTGHLMIDRRVNFQCSYNLAKRVLPRGAHTLRRNIDDWHRWVTVRSVGCLGVGTVQHVADYYRQPVPVTRATLLSLENAGEVLRVEVEGWREPAYMLPSDLPLLRKIEGGGDEPGLTTLLSPFDNLISYRPRVKELFNFDYRSEMYTPLAKRDRVYGYYVMPILCRGQLIGRLDPKVDRRAGILIIRSIYMEQWVRITGKLISDLVAMLREFMGFHNCYSIQIEHAVPPTLRRTLLSRLARH